MTPRETLEKYGLKTDVKSIRERVEKDTHWALARSLSINNPMQFSKTSIENMCNDIRTADLALLCELAEKGEKWIEWNHERKKYLAQSKAKRKLMRSAPKVDA